MKKSMKPISSPGRGEKFPPPLMRFLRSNVGSKSSSRGRRSRANPMFIRKKNTVIETTQEPSSPKVTCIGQVRVRRSKKNKPTTTTATSTTLRHPPNRRCTCLRKLKPTSCISIWRQWVSFFRCGFRKTKTAGDSSPVTESSPITESRNTAAEHGGGHVNVEADDQGLITGSPPRNALLLTRCRSAPYRSSSLASKLWESTVEKTAEEEVAEKLEKLSTKEEEERNDVVIGSENGGEAIKAAPLILSRCKSEPARTWDQLLV